MEREWSLKSQVLLQGDDLVILIEPVKDSDGGFAFDCGNGDALEQAGNNRKKRKIV